jgi:molecular chaperone IbpA
MFPSDYDNDPFGFNKVARSVSIGFDDILRRLSEAGSEPQATKPFSFPPYNIKKTGDNVYVLEMAVAGFGKQDIEITLEEDVLTIKGNISADSDSTGVIYKGIAERNFTRKFTLADTIQVKSSTLANGMLKIFLERFIPEDKKPKKEKKLKKDKNKKKPFTGKDCDV